MDELFNALDSEVGAETENALEHFMGDAEMYLKYLREFPQEPSMGRLRAAVAAKDYDAAEKAVHALKGIVANLGLVDVMDTAMEVLLDFREGAPEAAVEKMQELNAAYDKTVQVIANWETKQHT